MNDVSNVAESLDEKPQTPAVDDVAWLAEGEIPRAAVTLLSGEPGSGKSFVACTLAATVSQTPDARVLFAHTEPALRLHARLNRAGADASRIALIGGWGQGVREGFGIQDSAFSMPPAVGQAFQPDAATVAGRSPEPSKIQNLKSKIAHRLDWLLAWLSGAASVSRADLIVVDDLETFLGKALSAAELAEATARLDELARMSGAAVLAVVRSATTTEGRMTARALDRLMRAADVVWMVAADREMSGRRWLAPLKNNLAPLPQGKTFQIVEGRAEWLTGAVPEDALAPGSRRMAERADRQTAGQWLFEALRDRDVPSRMLYAQARQCGFSRNTILRAAHRMGMHSHKSAFDGGWMYSLRDASREAIEAYRPKVKEFDGRGAAAREGFKIVQGNGEQGIGNREQGIGSREQGIGNRGQRTGVSGGLGTQDSGFRASETPTGAENAENCSKSPKGPKSNHQTPATDRQAPAINQSFPARCPRLGPRDLPPCVPPEPELRDHLGRTTAKAVETWERWYHQWHREIRKFNSGYQFQT